MTKRIQGLGNHVGCIRGQDRVDELLHPGNGDPLLVYDRGLHRHQPDTPAFWFRVVRFLGGRYFYQVCHGTD